MRKVPVKMPTKSEEITSLINNAITMATKGGRIDIHNGMGPVTGPNTYNNAMPTTRAKSTTQTIHFFFMMHKKRVKNTIFYRKSVQSKVFGLIFALYYYLDLQK